ncbi:MAG: hypothetical protein LBV80_07285 [Deltaproteobacteria bacterium]|jgi:hypothetical protein|nr:hypothetical protein [Deltaproteobacteria bacterium]
MSGNFPAQVAPMGHVARVALQEQEAGFIKQQAMQQVITQHLTKDNEQVQSASAGEQGQRVRRRRHGRERDGRQSGNFEEELSGQMSGQSSGQADGSPSGDSQSAGSPVLDLLDALGQPEPVNQDGNVWAGNIVNVKV